MFVTAGQAGLQLTPEAMDTLRQLHADLQSPDPPPPQADDEALLITARPGSAASRNAAAHVEGWLAMPESSQDLPMNPSS